ncbi:hypothetical protein D3C76_985230 [compost metagenome]
MIERIHICTPEAAVLLDPIPMLPNRRRTFRHLIQPGWIILLKKKLIREFIISNLAEHRIQIWCAHESSSQMILSFSKQLSELLNCTFFGDPFYKIET